jgi:hypothetical protein
MNESIWGWALRTAEMNGHPNPNMILKYAGIVRGSHLSRREVLRRLGGLVDASSDQFDPIVPRMSKGGSPHTAFFCLSLPSWMVESRRPKVCPRCLKERAFLPREWELSIWTTCPTHGCFLIRNCPKCQSPISRFRRAIDNCRRCGYRFSRAEGTCASKSEVELVSFVAEKLCLLKTQEPSPYFEVFGHLPPDDVIRMIAAVGIAAGRQLLELKPHQWVPVSAITSFAAGLLSNWPRGFHALLEKSENPSRKALEHRFGELYSRLARPLPYPSTMPKSCSAIFRRELFAYLRETRPTSDCTGANESSIKWISRTEVSNLFNMTTYQVACLVECEGIPAIQIERTGSLYVDSRYLDNFESQKRADWISVNRTAQLLGVHQKIAQKLIRAGFVKQMHRPHVRISRASIQDLIDHIAALHRKRKRTPIDQLTLAEIAMAYSRIDIEHFLRKVVEGRLIPAGVNEAEIGLRRFLFERADFEICANEIKLETGIIDRKAAASMLHAKLKDVQRLLRFGYLEPAFQETSRFEVTLSSIQRFNDAFATTGTIARSYRLSKKTARARLQALGLRPILDSTGDDSRSFWDREQVKLSLQRGVEAKIAA